MKIRQACQTKVYTALMTALVTTGCFGNLGTNNPQPLTSPPTNKASAYPAASIRRLSNTQIVNSIQDIFMGGAPLDPNLLPMTKVRDGFDDQDLMLAVNTPFMTLVQQASEVASAYVVAHNVSLVGCDVTQISCINTYIQRVGRQAFRRPLTGDEIASYAKMVSGAPAGTDAPTALSEVVEAMIQSPFFIYRSELGEPAADGNTVQPLTPYETAAAMAYFVLNSSPDDALLDAAANNQLSTAAQRAAQVERLMGTSRAEAGMWNFMMQWANLSSSATLSGAFSSDVSFTPAVADAAVQQSRLGFSHEIFDGDGEWANLLLSSSAYVNSDLAFVVDANQNSLNANFVFMPLDPTTHSGFLTQTAFLASQSDPNSFSPVLFGFYVATTLFCNSIPPPPPNIPPLPSDANGSLSPRQRFASHLTNPACASCHNNFQPMGWAFEQYAPSGVYAPTFAGVPLTGAGTITGTDVDGDFVGARGLAERIATSDQAKTCFAAKMYEYALGRTESIASQRSAVDQASIAASSATFSAKQTNIISLMKSIVQSEAFMMRDIASVPTGVRP